ncbi:MAG: 4Fe-4S dicluster domain-containing protein [Candidatus Altiarchaeota archaeon]
MVEIKINLAKCNGCRACVEICPVGIYAITDEKVKISGRSEECLACRACETSCPTGAISILE